MSEQTAIEWCDHTWSPWEGCTKVSPGCDHCYAAARNGRFAKGANWGAGAPRRKTVDWSKPYAFDRAAKRDCVRRSLFPSLCDPFDNEAPVEWRAEFFLMLIGTPNLDHLLLTKRIGNAAAMIEEAVAAIRAELPMVPAWPWPNVWLGATVVNQAEADRDIPKLLAVPARVRFLSIEPMLGPIQLGRWVWTCCGNMQSGSEADGMPGGACCGQPERSDELDWVIVGSESGYHARRDPAMIDWVRSIKDQCVAAGVPFLWKQDAEHGRKISTPELDGRTWVEFPK